MIVGGEQISGDTSVPALLDGARTLQSIGSAVIKAGATLNSKP